MAYSDVCVSQSGKVCVSDRLNGKINIFKRDDVTFELIDTVGVQSDKMIEGDSTKATLEEPFGVEFLGEAIYICCHRTGLKRLHDTRIKIQLIFIIFFNEIYNFRYTFSKFFVYI